MAKMNIAGTTSGDFVQLENVILDVMSKEILFEAEPIMRFESIAVIRTELSSMPGNKINFLKYHALDGDSALGETDTIDPTAMSTETIDISVSEHARAVRVSEFLLRSAVTDTLRDAAIQLARHYARSRDALIRDALMTGTNVKYAKGRANRAGLIATDVFDVDLVRDVVELLATNKAPKFNLDAYITFVHPHQGRYLRSDSDWVNVNLYASPESIKSGEIGRIEDMRFIETTHIHVVKMGTQDIWADNLDTGKNTSVAANAATDVYRSVTVGDYAVGLAVGLPVEMRDNGVEDFGRRHSIAYYGIWGAGLIEEAHSVISETA